MIKLDISMTYGVCVRTVLIVMRTVHTVSEDSVTVQIKDNALC